MMDTGDLPPNGTFAAGESAMPATTQPSLAALRREIARGGPVSFSRFHEAALYGPDGFYTAGRGAGRRRDFLTSPEVGPLFGAVLAGALDAWWDELGRPDPFAVVECGAGPGTLAAAVLHAHPACARALRYVLVDVAEPMRAVQRSLHACIPLSELLGPIAAAPTAAGDGGGDGDGDGDGDVVHARGTGPLVAVTDVLPTLDLPGVVLANELLDNCPVDIAVRTRDGWDEVRVGHDGEAFAALAFAASPRLRAFADRFAPGAPVGARVPVARAAAEWLSAALQSLPRGRVVVIDYGADTAVLAARQWLRTYARHERGTDPFDAPGTRDITTDVPFDQLRAERRPVADRNQADFLRAYGIDALVHEGRALWEAHAAMPTLAALTGRSRVAEAHALLDESGLGAFRVVEWRIG